MLLLYHDAKVYQTNAAGGWWYKTIPAAAWSNTIGDPRVTSPTPTPVTPPAPPPVPTPVPQPQPVPGPGPTPAPGGGTGPIASSAFCTVDFGAPTGRVASRYLWGIAAAAPNDNGFALCGQESFLKAAEQISPSLYRINSNSGGKHEFWSDYLFRNGVNNPDWNEIAPFIKNGYRFLKGDYRLIIGIRWNKFSVSDYAIACGKLAQYLKTTPGGDGKPLRVWGWEIGNEDDDTEIGKYLQYFKAGAAAIQSVNADARIIGPVDSWMHSDRCKAVAQAGVRNTVVCWHNYQYCPENKRPGDAEILSYTGIARDSAGARAVSGSNVDLMCGEWNMICAPGGETRQQQPMAAAFAAQAMIAAVNAGSGISMGALWEMAQDSEYGVIQGGKVMPIGRFMGRAGAVMDGKQASSKTTDTKLVTLGVSNGSNVGVLLVNTGTDRSLSGQVALSRAPTTLSTLRSYEVSDAQPDGRELFVAVRDGLTAPVTVPARGVVLLSP